MEEYFKLTKGSETKNAKDEVLLIPGLIFLGVHRYHACRCSQLYLPVAETEANGDDIVCRKAVQE